MVSGVGDGLVGMTRARGQTAHSMGKPRRAGPGSEAQTWQVAVCGGAVTCGRQLDKGRWAANQYMTFR